jgi:uncharacterized protein (DUF486 family)
MLPANPIGFEGNGGLFTSLQLHIIQEVIILTVFTIIAIVVFKTETFTSNHLIGFGFLILGVYFIFRSENDSLLPAKCSELPSIG